jgi:hypothetical protein
MQDQANNDDARWLVQSARGALDAACWLNTAGLVLCCALLWSTLFKPAPALAVGAAVVVGLAQLGLLARIAIDRRLFAALSETCVPADLDALDRALTALGWKPANAPPRPLAGRCRGAARFLYWAVLFALAQTAVFAAWVFR